MHQPSELNVPQLSTTQSGYAANWRASMSPQITGRLGWCCIIVFSLLSASPMAWAEDPVRGASQAADAPADDAADRVDLDAPQPPMTSGEVLIRKLIAGGWTMFFLLLVSIVGVSVGIERCLRLRRGAIAPLSLAEDANRLWQAQKLTELVNQAKGSNSTLGRVIAALVQHRTSSHADLNTIAGDIASRDLRRHMQRSYPLLVVATISPLLGLLGTVIGMVGAFSTIEALGELANPAAFGGDISKALITTGAGLSVAVPALTAYHFFKSRTLTLGVELEEIASELIVEWFIPHEPVEPTGQRPSEKPEATAQGQLHAR